MPKEALPHTRGVSDPVKPAAPAPVVETPPPMQLAETYGFERHRRVAFCELI